MNNRTIKFRAFDKRPERREMIYGIQDGSGFRGQSFGEYLAYPDTYEVMQFTGLTDANGKGIYEGDIIKTSDDCKGEVYYVDGAYFIDLVNTGDYLFDVLIEGGAQVIGNIFENPELAK